MKLTKIERVMNGLTTERMYLLMHAAIMEAPSFHEARELLLARVATVDEILRRLGEVDAPEPKAETPKRTRKARKAGLPEVA